MSYQVLARKYRPATFREMVGQEHVVRALANALDREQLHHAYLFTGTRGVGKTTVARIFAKCLNCETGVTSQPCGTCAACTEIAEGRSVDLLEVDAASRTKVEDTRELLENVQYAPTSSRYKVYLIDEVHMLSSHSFNALLKTLEEPPPHVKFLLATTDPQKLPATVLSRCLQFNLKNMPPEQIVTHLAAVLERESIPCDEAALWMLGRAAAGSMRDALSLTDQAIAFGSGAVHEADVRNMLGSVDLKFIYELVEAAGAGDAARLLEVVSRMAEHVVDFGASLDELLQLLHRVATAQAVPDAVDGSWGDADRLRELAASLPAEDVQLFYQIALNGKRDIELAPHPRAGFEMALLRMVAFRPVYDEATQAANTPAADVRAAREGGTTAKKSVEQAPSAAVRARPAEQKAGVAPVSGPAVEAGPAKSAEPGPAEPGPAEPGPAEPGPAEPGPAEPAPAEPAPVQPGPVASGALQLEPGEWHELLARLGLAGIVQSVASNCALSQCEGSRIHFVLDARNAALYNDGHRGQIQAALCDHYQRAIEVRIETGEPATETPAMRQQRLRRERQAAAVSAIEGDPNLQALISRFDGELDRSSIAPVERSVEESR